MKYTTELTDNQKKQMDLLCELAHRYIGFNPKLEMIETTNVEDTKEYQIGFENGKLWAAEANAKDRQGYYDKGYNKGLDDACLTAWTLLTSTNTGEIFTEYGLVSDILGNVPMKEIRSRIKAYEEKKKAEKIKVGDEVTIGDGDTKAIVTRIEGRSMRVLYPDGTGGMFTIIENALHKTGRNYSDVLLQLLSKLKERDNEQ